MVFLILIFFDVVPALGLVSNFSPPPWQAAGDTTLVVLGAGGAGIDVEIIATVIGVSWA